MMRPKKYIKPAISGIKMKNFFLKSRGIDVNDMGTFMAGPWCYCDGPKPPGCNKC